MSQITGIQGLISDSLYGTSKITSTEQGNTESPFSSVFQAAMNMVNETNELSNKAEEEEIKFALGESDNTHDLQIAQSKANISLSYTVAVRKSVMDAYKEIMNLQF